MEEVGAPLLGTLALMFVGALLCGAAPFFLRVRESHLQTLAALGAGLLIGSALAVIVPEGFHAFAEVGVGLHSGCWARLVGLAQPCCARALCYMWPSRCAALLPCLRAAICAIHLKPAHPLPHHPHHHHHPHPPHPPHAGHPPRPPRPWRGAL